MFYYKRVGTLSGWEVPAQKNETLYRNRHFVQNRIIVIIHILEFPLGGEDRVSVGHGREERGEEVRGRGMVIQANASAGMDIEKMMAREKVPMPGVAEGFQDSSGLPSIKKFFVMKNVKHIQK